MREARQVITVLLTNLSSAKSFWYTINGDPNYEFSLCRRFGFTSSLDYYALLIHAGLAGYEEKKDGSRCLQVYISQWKDFLADTTYDMSADTDTDRAEAVRIDFDMEGCLNGKQNDKERQTFYAIRIGKNVGTYHRKITAQLKGGKNTTPPRLPALGDMQRSFGGRVRPLIIGTIIDNDDVFKEYNNAWTYHRTEARKRHAEEVPTATATPSPAKRMRLDTNDGSNTTTPERMNTDAVEEATTTTTTPESITQHTPYPFINRAQVAAGEDDKFLTELVAKRGVDSGNNVVLKYNDYRNGNDKFFVKVPQNSTDKSFRTSAA